MEKTLAMKVLEGKKVAFEAVEYPSTERDAVQVAGALGVPPGQVFKTLVVTRPAGKPLLVMIPADRQLDLKQVAAAVGEKKLKMATHQEAEALTGLQVGGISALAVGNRPFVVYIDSAAREYEQIYISAGKRGINLKVGVKDLVKVTGARWVGDSER
ncbi:MAG: aminoacyl-tRNA deacylase [Ardenticatenaceae bacterium]|nr:aminoacyl-tRNA deacylase [Ardenticatenaceae bacterium]